MQRYVFFYFGVLSIALCSAPAAADLDVVFLLDTTGSMSSEIREVKDRVFQLSTALKESRKGERVRFGVVAYRDVTDAYLTKKSPLTDNIKKSETFLSALRADGGGDSPEDVLSGLSVALDEMDWAKNKQTDKQIFLIGDAPPHLDYKNGPKVPALLAGAQQKRVVVNAIGCRSLSQDGISFFRKVAYATEGSYQHIGRVTSGDKGLADAMLKTLVPKHSDSNFSDATPVALKHVATMAPSKGTAIFVKHEKTRNKSNSTPKGACDVSISLPDTLSFASEPVAGQKDGQPVFTLTLKRGKGGRFIYRLPDCTLDFALSKAPIHVLVGGVK